MNDQRTYRKRLSKIESIMRLVFALALLLGMPGFSVAQVAQAAEPEVPTIWPETPEAELAGTLSLSVSGEATYTQGSDPVKVAEGLTLTGDEPSIEGAKVVITDNFNAQADKLGIEGQDGNKGTTPEGIAWSYDAERGVLSLSSQGKEKTPADYQATLRRVTYVNLQAPEDDTPARTLVFSIGENSLYFPGTGHYYEFITQPGVRWSQGNTSANQRTFYGLQGYLATITTAEENAFLAQKISGVGWIGASDEAQEGEWLWVTGPEADQKFWTGGKNGSKVGGMYSNWNRGEPNNYGSGEPYGHMIYDTSIGARGSWNDLPDAGGGGAYRSHGYLVEYGGMPEETPPTLSGEVSVNFEKAEPLVDPANIEADFTCSEQPGWTLADFACLTADGISASGGKCIPTPDQSEPDCQGWLRLTDATNNKRGYAIYNKAFSSKDNVIVEFEYAIYGGSGADGITFFLIDGKTERPEIGSWGGCLAYSRYSWDEGITNGYVGIGIDEWGNFSDRGHGGTGPGRRPDSVTIRGSGNGKVGYNYLTQSQVAKEFGYTIDGKAATRDNPRRVKIFIIDQKITVQMDFRDDKGYQTIIDEYNLAGAAGQAPIPPSFKMGFAGSTGGATNVHEIRGLKVKRPTDLSITNTTEQTNLKAGDSVSYKLVATNSAGPNDAMGATVIDNLPANITNVSWTCTAASGATCAAASGEGNVNVGVDLPIGGSVTIEVQATLGSVDGDTLRNVAEVVPPADMLDPDDSNNKATATVSVIVNQNPTDIDLTNDDVDEDRDPGTHVGSFTTEDPDEDDEHTYTLVDDPETCGAPNDNASFKLEGNALLTNATFHYNNAKKEYTVCVRSTDRGKITITKKFIIVINRINKIPTVSNLSLSLIEDMEKTIGGALFTGGFSDGNDDALKIVKIVSLPTQGTLKLSGRNVRVGEEILYADLDALTYMPSENYNGADSFRWNGSDGEAYANAPADFNLTITPANDAPTNIDLSNDSFEENKAGPFNVGSFTSTDPDEGDSHTYELVTGDGDDDNGMFDITGGVLSVKDGESFDYERKRSYTIRVRTTDKGGLTYDKNFVINVTNVNDAPTLEPGNDATTPGGVLDPTNTGRVKVNHNDNLKLTELTVSVWVRPTQIKGQWQPLVVKANDSNGSPARNYSLWIVPNSMAVHTSIYNGACNVNYWYNSTHSLVLNQWNHVVMTFDGRYQRLYINGVLSVTGDHGSNGGICTTSTGPLMIGYSSTPYTPLAGNIDEVSIWNKSNIGDNWTAIGNRTPLYGNEPNLVAYYRFNTPPAGTGDTVEDSAGDNNGTLENGARIVPNFSAPEDNTITITLNDFEAMYFDEDKNALDKVQITTLPTNGTFTFNGTAVIVNQEITRAALATGQLVYTPDANWNGTTSMVWKGYDGEKWSTGTTKTSTFNLVITPVEDAPTIESGNGATDEDTALTFSADDFTALYEDNDGDVLASITLTVLPTNGTITLGGNAYIVNTAIPSAQIGTLVYTPDPNYTGADEFTWQASDGNGDSNTATFSIDVAGTNDAPTLSDIGPLELDEDTTHTFGNEFSNKFTDPDGDTLVRIKITSLPEHGKLQLSGTDIGRGDEIAAGDLSNLTYTPDENYHGTDSFGWNASDGVEYAVNGKLVNLTITAVNDAPTGVDISEDTVDENVPEGTVVGELDPEDVDEGGTYTYELCNEENDNAHFTIDGNTIKTKDVFDYESPVDGDTENDYDVCVSITDNSGPGDPITVEFTITIYVGDANDAPTVSDIERTVDEDKDGGLSIGFDDFETGFSETDVITGWKELRRVDITSLPSNGKLTIHLDHGNDKVDWQRVTEPSFIDFQVASQQHVTMTLVYTPNPNYNGKDSFAWSACDAGLKCSETGAWMNINVNATNDAPMVSNGRADGLEDATITFTADSFTELFFDIDDGDAMTKIEITSLPTNGTLKLGENDVTVGQIITLAELNDEEARLTYMPNADYYNMNGTTGDPDTFGWNASDDDKENPKMAAEGAEMRLWIQQVLDENGTVRVSTPDMTVDEGDQTITIEVERVGDNEGEVSIVPMIDPGTTVEGDNPTLEPVVLTWGNGEGGKKTVTLTLKGNDTVQPTKERSLKVKLGEPSGGLSVAEYPADSVNITIVDDEESGALRFWTPQLWAWEAQPSTDNCENDVGLVTVERYDGTNGEISVQIALDEDPGTASVDADYEGAFPMIVTFAEGETYKKVCLPIVDDDVFEDDETINLILTEAEGGRVVLGDRVKGTFLICNDDAPVPGAISFTDDNATVSEGAGTISLMVERTDGADTPVAVKVVKSGTSANIATIVTDTLSWARGDMSGRQVLLNITDDDTVQTDEEVAARQFVLTLTNVDLGLGEPTFAPNQVITVTVEDDEEPGELRFTSPTYTYPEDEDGEVVIERVGGSDGEVNVTIDCGDNADVVCPEPFTIEDGTWVVTKTISITPDGVYTPEGRVVEMKITTTTPYGKLGEPVEAEYVATNVDDPMPGAVEFITDTLTVGEGDGTAEFVVRRVGGSDLPISVTVTVEDITTNPGHYGTPEPTKLAWGHGVSGTLKVQLPITDDEEFNPAKRFRVVLSKPTNGATVGENATMIVEIVDNELPPAVMQPVTAEQVSENPLVITVGWVYDQPERIDHFEVTRDGVVVDNNVPVVRDTVPFTYTIPDDHGKPADGGEYEYGVKACYGATCSEPVMVKVKTSLYLFPPTNLVIEEKTTDPVVVELTWDEGESGQGTGFEVIANPNSPAELKLGGTIQTPDGTNVVSYTLDDDRQSLMCGTTYMYGVRAVQGTSVVTSSYTFGTLNTADCPVPELVVTLEGPDSAERGAELEYTLTVSNIGAGQARNILLYNKLPAGAEYVDGSADVSGRSGQGEVRWDINSLAAGESVSRVFKVKAYTDITNDTFGAFYYNFNLTRSFRAYGQADMFVTTSISAEEPDINACYDKVEDVKAQLKQATQRLSAFQAASLTVADDAATREVAVRSVDEVAETTPAEANDDAELNTDPDGIMRRNRQRASEFGATPQAASDFMPGLLLRQEAAGNGTISGVVQTPEGVAVPGAKVRAWWYDRWYDEGTEMFVYTNANGEFTLPGLDENARWTVLGYAPWRTEEFENYQLSRFYDIDLFLESDGHYTIPEPLVVSPVNVTGRFVIGDGSGNATDEGLEWAEIRIEALDKNGNVDLSKPSWVPVTYKQDEDFTGGVFDAGNIPPGTYQARVDVWPKNQDTGLPDPKYDDYLVPDPVQFTVTSMDEVVQVNGGEPIVVEQTTTKIEGKVSVPSGAGVVGVPIEVHRTDGTGYRTGKTDGEGNYSIGVAPGEWVVAPNTREIWSSGNYNWVFTGNPRTVEVTDGAVTANIEVQQAQAYIKGRLIRPGSEDALRGGTNRRDAAIDVRSVEDGRVTSTRLAEDGSFSIPVLEGFYEVEVWLKNGELDDGTEEAGYPDLASEALPVVEVGANDVDLGDILLVRRLGVVEGYVTDNTDKPVAFQAIDIFEQGGRWYTTETDQYGYFSVAVPPGEWTVAPDLSPDAEGNPPAYVLEAGAQTVMVVGNDLNQTADFVLTQSKTTPLEGSFTVGEKVVDVDATVSLKRQGSSRQIANAPVVDGMFKLPQPVDCADCVLYASLATNAKYSFETSTSIAIGDEATATFAMTENTGTLTGSFVDASGNAVSGLIGEVTLLPDGNMTAARSTTIKQDGSYSFSYVGNATFTLRYNLQLTANALLVSGSYLPSSVFGMEVTMTGGEVSQNVVLETGATFDVTVQPPEGFDAINYPTFVTCAYSSTATTSLSWTDDCVASDTAGTATCVKRDAGQSCSVDFGEIPIQTQLVKPQGQSIASAANMQVTLRQVDSYIVGQLRDADGNLVRNGQVTISGSDGQTQLVLTDANGCYVGPVAQPKDEGGDPDPEAEWIVDPVIEVEVQEPDTGKKKKAYKAPRQVITNPSPDPDTGVVTPPEPVTQVEETPVELPEPVSETFDNDKGTTVEAPAVDTEQGTDNADPGRTVKVEIPPETMPTDSEEEIQISVDPAPAEVPEETATETLVGKPYSVGFVEKDTKRKVQVTLQKKVTISLPYNENTTVDDEKVKSAKLIPAFFSPLKKKWIPIEEYTVDEETKEVKVSVEQTSEGPVGLIVDTSARVAETPITEDPNITVANGGTLESTTLAGLDSVSATFPPNAVTADAYGTIEDPDTSLDSGIADAVISGFGLNVADMDGNTLAKASTPITLTIRYSDTITGEEELAVAYYSGGGWSTLSQCAAADDTGCYTIDTESNTITVVTDQLTEFRLVRGSVATTRSLYLPMVMR